MKTAVRLYYEFLCGALLVLSFVAITSDTSFLLPLIVGTMVVGTVFVPPIARWHYARKAR